MRVLKIIVALAILSYVSLLVIFYKEQRQLLYFPSRVAIPLPEAGANKRFTEINSVTADGVSLKSWYAPPKEKHCTLVFFHGNGDSLATAAPIAEPYLASGYGFLLTEYRGYSGLAGTPTEQGLYNDARANLEALADRGVPNAQIIVFGHSLGTGVAVQMASEGHGGGLMLLAPYLSISKVGWEHYPFLPVGLLAKDRFDSQKKIRKVHAPILIARGSEDQVISPTQGDELYSLANGPKEFHSIGNKGHNDAFDAFALSALDWLQKTCPAH